MHTRTAAGLALATLVIAFGCGGTATVGNGAPPKGPDAGGDGANPNPADCPATEPESSVSCTQQGLHCNYSLCTTCSCNQGTWYCAAPGCSGETACPATLPVEGSSCGAAMDACCGGVQETPCTYPSDAGDPEVVATCDPVGQVWQLSATADAGGEGGD
jgi:hypothetical protein